MTTTAHYIYKSHNITHSCIYTACAVCILLYCILYIYTHYMWVCVYIRWREDENYDSDPLSKSMKTTILPRCYYTITSAYRAECV